MKNLHGGHRSFVVTERYVLSGLFISLIYFSVSLSSHWEQPKQSIFENEYI